MAKVKKIPILGTDHKGDLVRLRRIKGQIEGIERMIENKRYCVEILDQMKSIFSALRSVENQMLQRHMEHCIHDAIQSSEPRRSEEKMREIITLLNKR